jgi:hypothetical protein
MEALADPADQATFVRMLGRAVSSSLLYAPLAILVALASVLGLVDLISAVGVAHDLLLIVSWLVTGHAAFVALAYSWIAGRGEPLREKGAAVSERGTETLAASGDPGRGAAAA